MNPELVTVFNSAHLTVTKYREIHHDPINIIVSIRFHNGILQLLLVHNSRLKSKATFKTRFLCEIGVHFRSWIVIGEEADEFRRLF